MIAADSAIIVGESWASHFCSLTVHREDRFVACNEECAIVSVISFFSLGDFTQ